MNAPIRLCVLRLGKPVIRLERPCAITPPKPVLPCPAKVRAFWKWMMASADFPWLASAIPKL